MKCKVCGKEVYRGSKFCGNCGAKVRNKNIVLWVVGWLLCFPIPITILLWRKSCNINKILKVVLSIVVWLFALLMVSGKGNSAKAGIINNKEVIISNGESEVKMKSDDNNSDTNDMDELSPTHDNIEVSMDVSARQDDNLLVFDINTNLPDETELVLTLSRGDYNTDDYFTEQTKVTIQEGTAVSDGFSNKGDKLSGNYDLSVSMSLPSTQSDFVRSIIGEQGEYLTGNLVENSGFEKSNTVEALFNVEIGDEISIIPTDDYTNTIFREEDEEESEVTESNMEESNSDAASNKEFLAKYESGIIAAASMALDNFISDYKMSLAPQKWTIAKFDSSETAVIAMTDITYQGNSGKYIYVGSLNINNVGKVESAKPHYVYVIDTVLGDDGYCDDVFDKLNNLKEN